MAKAKLEQITIPKFPSEAEEAAWWDAHRAEVEVDIRARLTNLAEHTATKINERAAKMTPERRAGPILKLRKLLLECSVVLDESGFYFLLEIEVPADPLASSDTFKYDREASPLASQCHEG